jgi:hypothetical protein
MGDGCDTKQAFGKPFICKGLRYDLKSVLVVPSITYMTTTQNTISPARLTWTINHGNLIGWNDRYDMLHNSREYAEYDAAMRANRAPLGANYFALDMENAEVRCITVAIDEGRNWNDDSTDLFIELGQRYFIIATFNGEERTACSNNMPYRGYKTEADAHAALAKMKKAAAKHHAEQAVCRAYQGRAEELIGAAWQHLSFATANTQVGDVIKVRAHTAHRAALVIEVTRSRVKVVYSTNGNRGNAAYSAWIKKVSIFE